MADADPTLNGPPPLAAGQIEIWKKVVDVQQHFNDLELRIRNFALVVTGAFLGLGGYAIKDGGMITAFGHEVSLAGIVVLSAIVPLFAFYFMDRLWYHRLLEGSVKAGVEAETALKELGYKVDLGSKISKYSPFTLWFTKIEIHSPHKMDIFYWMLAVALFAVAGCLGLGFRPQASDSKSTTAAIGVPAASLASNTADIEPPANATHLTLPPPPAAAVDASTANVAAPVREAVK